MLKKVKGGWVIVHCTKPGMKGKRIKATKKPVSHAKALSIHRAIMASRSKKKKMISGYISGKKKYPKTKKGDKALIFNHSLLHSFWKKCQKGRCPKNWQRPYIRKMHNYHVKEMIKRGFKHKSPLR